MTNYNITVDSDSDIRNGERYFDFFIVAKSGNKEFSEWVNPAAMWLEETDSMNHAVGLTDEEESEIRDGLNLLIDEIRIRENIAAIYPECLADMRDNEKVEESSHRFDLIKRELDGKTLEF